MRSIGTKYSRDEKHKRDHDTRTGRGRSNFELRRSPNQVAQIHPACGSGCRRTRDPCAGRDTSIYHSTNSRNEQVTILTNRGESNLNLKELQDFAHVTNADPNVAPALSKNPALVDNATFVAKDPALAHFLANYPGADEDVRAHPATSSNQRMHRPGTDNQPNQGSAE
jgi:hypothetical protein